MHGIKAAGDVTPDWGKVTARIQFPNEHPSDICTRLTHEIRKHGSLDPDAEHGREMIKMVFMAERAEDIARRFREWYARKSLPEIVSVATRVYNGRGEKGERAGKQIKRIRGIKHRCWQWLWQEAEEGAPGGVAVSIGRGKIATRVRMWR